MSVVLETTNLNKSFGGITATDNVSFKLMKGARHALIGPNGAGKTTFVNQLTGVLKPTSGRITLMGEDITGLNREARVKRGIARRTGGFRPYGKGFANVLLEVHPVRTEQRDELAADVVAEEFRLRFGETFHGFGNAA